MKKLTALILSLVMVILLLPARAFAATTGTCGESVTWTLDGSVLTISGTGDMADYTDTECPWYAQRTQIKTIVVEEGVTSIGDSAFRYHINATEARLPSTLKEIGAEAFMACYALQKADLPAGLETLRESAFSNCLALNGIVLPETLTTLEPRALQYTGITAITIPASITVLPEYCFYGCKSLTDVQLHNGITAIGDFCFGLTESLLTVDLPDRLTTIEWGLFSISGLTTITIPDGVTLIEDYAFSQCEALAQISIPNSVTYISDLAFRDTKSLKTIDLPDGLTKTSHGMFSGSGLVSIELPDGLVTVEENTFIGCEDLTTVTIPDSVEYMEDYCFSGCTSLTTVELSSNTKMLGWGAFQDSALRTITIPASCTYTEDYVFSGCNDLQSITYLGEDLDFGDLAFRNCQGPAEFDLPAGLTKVSYGMFFDSSVERVVLPDTVTFVDDLAFYNCDSLTEVVFPDALTELGNYLFKQCDGIETVNLPASLKAIPWGLFMDSSIREITIPDGVTTIHNQAFWNCAGLEKLVVPASVTSVGTDSVFDGADQLVIWCWTDSFIHSYAEENGIPYVLMDGDSTEPIVPDVPPADSCGENAWWDLTDGVLTISGTGDMADYGNGDCPWYDRRKEVRTIVVEEGITSIGDHVFAYHINATETRLPSTLKEIGAGAFSACYALEKANLPDGLVRIGESAFSSCKALDGIVLPQTLTTLEANAFRSTGLTSVTIPASVTVLPEYCFYNCKSLTDVRLHDGITEIRDFCFSLTGSLETIELPTGLTTIEWGCFSFSGLRELVIPDGVTTLESQAFRGCADLEKLVVPASVTDVDADLVFFGADKLTIWCWADSCIHSYAEENGIPYVLMDGMYENPFTDVSEEDFYYEPVLWAVAEGITTGTGPDTFSPNAPCQRAQVVTFLWRAMGSPEPKLLMNPFTDVSEQDFYYKAVLWAVEAGITNGMTATTFGPNAVCNRAQVVTFLHRALGRPAAENAVNTFTDVRPGDYFYDAVLWAASTGVTSGVDAATFAPERDCVRAQVVTFLYRALAE